MNRQKIAELLLMKQRRKLSDEEELTLLLAHISPRKKDNSVGGVQQRVQQALRSSALDEINREQFDTDFQRQDRGTSSIGHDMRLMAAALEMRKLVTWGQLPCHLSCMSQLPEELPNWCLIMVQMWQPDCPALLIALSQLQQFEVHAVLRFVCVPHLARVLEDEDVRSHPHLQTVLHVDFSNERHLRSEAMLRWAAEPYHDDGTLHTRQLQETLNKHILRFNAFHIRVDSCADLSALFAKMAKLVYLEKRLRGRQLCFTLHSALPKRAQHVSALLASAYMDADATRSPTASLHIIGWMDPKTPGTEMPQNFRYSPGHGEATANRRRMPREDTVAVRATQLAMAEFEATTAAALQLEVLLTVDSSDAHTAPDSPQDSTAGASGGHAGRSVAHSDILSSAAAPAANTRMSALRHALLHSDGVARLRLHTETASAAALVYVLGLLHSSHRCNVQLRFSVDAAAPYRYRTDPSTLHCIIHMFFSVGDQRPSDLLISDLQENDVDSLELEELTVSMALRLHMGKQAGRAGHCNLKLKARSMHGVQLIVKATSKVSDEALLDGFLVQVLVSSTAHHGVTSCYADLVASVLQEPELCLRSLKHVTFTITAHPITHPSN